MFRHPSKESVDHQNHSRELLKSILISLLYHPYSNVKKAGNKAEKQVIKPVTRSSQACHGS